MEMLTIPSDWPEDVPVPPPIPRHYFEGSEWIGEHMAELRRQYPDQWVAVYNGEVIAAGTNLGEVERVAHAKTGERDIAIELIESGVRFHSGLRILSG